jgi:hypothetical protein
MDERQQPLQDPQGTSAPPFPDRNEASVRWSHAEKSPAGTPSGPLEATIPPVFLLLIPFSIEVGRCCKDAPGRAVFFAGGRVAH